MRTYHGNTKKTAVRKMYNHALVKYRNNQFIDQEITISSDDYVLFMGNIPTPALFEAIDLMLGDNLQCILEVKPRDTV